MNKLLKQIGSYYLKKLSPDLRGFAFGNFNMNHAVWLQADMESFARKGYAGNVYVYSAVKQISSRMASIPWSLYQVKDEKKMKQYLQKRREGKLEKGMKERVLEKIDGHALNDVLVHPNPLMDWSQYVEAVSGFKLIMGNSFVWGVGPDTGENAKKFMQLFPYRADQVTVEAPPYPQDVTAYKLGQKQVRPETIMHLRYFNPLSERIGMSPIEAAIHGITQSNAYSEWNTSLAQNMGRVPFILTVKVDNLTDEQKDKIKEDFRTQTAGSDNAGDPFVTNNDVVLEQMSINPKDTDWVNGYNITTAQIALAYDVPPQLLGDTRTSTYSNIKEMIRYFYMGKIIPEMDAFRDAHNNWLVRSWEPEGKLYLDYDLESIEVLQEERATFQGRTLEQFKGGVISLNEARELLGLDNVGPAGDIRLVPAGLIPLDEAFSENLTDEDVEKAVQRMFRKNGHVSEPV